ncbi:MAG: hypothetical protein C0525_01480 [Flavobacterium sp.]|uniref:hypothetical protein n=1 Tax=Flavobacterium sp. TaxID=239 RepID=UPI0025BA8885|nr:hypothetical protein [Flavobacterium sp.]MBA4133372.1 hypothetical protein [Flavobacterium sp.]
MPIKIQQIISSCNDCKFATEYKSTKDSYDYALMCHCLTGIGEDIEVEEVFLITTAREPILKSFKVDIPSNCPLKDYEPTT